MDKSALVYYILILRTRVRIYLLLLSFFLKNRSRFYWSLIHFNIFVAIRWRGGGERGRRIWGISIRRNEARRSWVRSQSPPLVHTSSSNHVFKYDFGRALRQEIRHLSRLTRRGERKKGRVEEDALRQKMLSEVDCRDGEGLRSQDLSGNGNEKGILLT